MTDSSEIGRYGTLRLLKRHEPDTTVAFFPIDDETVTFGRSKHCSVRLYYDCISELHCTLQISEEHKAFLLVQGTNGLLVDGCQVNPTGVPDAGPTTVPLTNGSEIEIYKKRFRFEYPPKEIRAALLATPRHAKARRSLRMSMIRSAQVFTPRGKGSGPPRTPHKRDQADNVDWEALRTPIRVPSDDGSLEQETTLLEGKEDRDAFIVEEEKDLIILELVDNQSQEELVPSLMPKANRGRSVAFSIPTETPPPRPAPIPQSARVPQNTSLITASHRRRSEPSLHRAVVLRSAQRALIREKERFEEAQEEDEVEAEVSPERELGPHETGYEDEDDAEDQDARTDEPEPYPLFTPSGTAARPARRISAFKASLDAMRKVIPLPFNWKAPEEVPLPDDSHDNYDEDLDEKENERDEGSRHQDAENNDADDEDEQHVYQTPIRRNLGPFMTPQLQLNRPIQSVPVDVKTRASIGGEGANAKIFGGAQRVRVVPAWKFTDLVLPEPQKSTVAEEKREIKKERISEEERQAIIARRKSALSTPSSLPMPGPRPSTFPPSAQIDAYTPGEDSNEDADTMLERMTQKMAGLRRKSEARKMRLSVGGRQQGEGFSLLASPERKVRGHPGIYIAEETPSQMKHSEINESGLPIKTAGSHEHNDLDLSKGSGGEDDAKPRVDVPGSGAVSLTPRFDGVRELFRQPRIEPKTPSFAGFEAMFKERSEAVSKTPSFRGMKEMFSRAKAGLATPRLDLGDFFDEDGDANVVDNKDSVTTQNAVSSEDEFSAPASTARSKRTPTTKASTSKRPYRKKDVAPVDVPSAVVEEQTSDQEDEDKDVNVIGQAEPAVRRIAKRSAKNTTMPVAGNAPSSGKSSGRGASRKTRQVTTTLESTTKGIVVHKTTKNKRIVEDDSEDELSISGKANGKRRNQQTDETEVETIQDEAPVKNKPGSRKTKEVEASDNEGVAPPKPRRTRAAKTPQGQIDTTEATPAPIATKATRRIKDEEIPEVEALAPAVSAPRSKRAARNKVVDESPISIDDHSSEEAPTTKARVSKRGSNKKTTVSEDAMSEDKENSGQKPSDKTPAARTRRAAVTPVETLDAPAKRTRSRK